jgi:hypothetical protein
VNALASENLRLLKEAKDLDELDNAGEMVEFNEEMFDELNKQKSVTFTVSDLLYKL